MEPTKTTYSHGYNPLGPSGYLITFHTYGTWLHGDSRGSTDRINNITGVPMLNSKQNRVSFDNHQSRMRKR